VSGAAPIRPAEARDVGAIVALMRELAEFEKLTHLFVATEADLADALFGERPAAEALVAEQDGAIVAYALFFHNYSTFVGRRGLYLEDLYVQPAQRGTGSAPRCCGTSPRSPSSAAARASNGRYSTGTAPRSTSTRRWARPCCPTGASCA
jgi:GNAT superfamily N-acetyltransferase